MTNKKIERVAVIGAGLMGNQIALQVALNGFETTCYSRRQETVNKATEFVTNWLEKNISKGKINSEDAITIQKKLLFTTDLKSACEKADIVIETVADVLETKRKVIADIGSFAKEHTIIASNSSYIVSSKFCDVVKNPAKVCNMHFFNPALVMKIVEVVKGPHTSSETVKAVYEFAENIGKDPVLVEKEIYGFIVNRIFSSLTKEACYLVDMGIASVQDIDKAVKGGLGHPMGPLELLDMTGIDLEYNVYMEKFKVSTDVADRPATCLTERFSKGEYGRKSGKGFYEYNK